MDKGKRRSFTCVHCESSGGVPYIAERYRVVDHIQKHHFSLDQTPYYCKLCMFRCPSRDALYRHVTSYRRHVLAAATAGGNVDLKRCLVENPNPRQILEGIDLREVTSHLNTGMPSAYNDNLDLDEFLSTSPPPTSSQSSNLISVQLTPEQLTAFLNQQQKGPAPSLEYDPQFPAMTRPPLPSVAPLPTKVTSSSMSAPSAFCSVLSDTSRMVPEYTATKRSVLSDTTAHLNSAAAPGNPPQAMSGPLFQQPDPSIRTSSNLSSRLNTPVLPDHCKAHRSSPGSIEEDITSQLLGPDPLSSVRFTPIPTSIISSKDQSIQTDDTPTPKSDEVLIEAITTSNKAVVDAISKIVTMVESNARAVRCLEATLTKFLPHVDKMARALDKHAEETRKANRRAEDEEHLTKRQKLEDKENLRKPENKKQKDVNHKFSKN